MTSAVEILHEPSAATLLERIQVRRSHSGWASDARWARAREQWLSAHAAEPNGQKVGITGIDSKAGEGLVVELCPTDWAMAQGGQAAVLDMSLEGRMDAIRRTGFSSEFRIPNIAVVHAILVTSDGIALLCPRSPSLRYHPGKWSASLEEGLEPEDFHSHHVLAGAMYRGAIEELGPRMGAALSRDAIYFAGLVMETQLMNPAIVVVGLLGVDYDGALAIAAPSTTEISDSRMEGFALDSVRTDLIRDAARTDGLTLVSGLAVAESDLHPTSRYRLKAAARLISSLDMTHGTRFPRTSS